MDNTIYYAEQASKMYQNLMTVTGGMPVSNPFQPASSIIQNPNIQYLIYEGGAIAVRSIERFHIHECGNNAADIAAVVNGKEIVIADLDNAKNAAYFIEMLTITLTQPWVVECVDVRSMIKDLPKWIDDEERFYQKYKDVK